MAFAHLYLFVLFDELRHPSLRQSVLPLTEHTLKMHETSQPTTPLHASDPPKPRALHSALSTLSKQPEEYISDPMALYLKDYIRLSGIDGADLGSEVPQLGESEYAQLRGRLVASAF